MGKMLVLMDCGTAWELTSLTPTSCWSAMIRSSAASSFPVTQGFVISGVPVGAVIPPRHTFARRPPMLLMVVWPSTWMAMETTSSPTGLWVLACVNLSAESVWHYTALIWIQFYEHVWKHVRSLNQQVLLCIYSKRDIKFPWRVEDFPIDTVRLRFTAVWSLPFDVRGIPRSCIKSRVHFTYSETCIKRTPY